MHDVLLTLAYFHSVDKGTFFFTFTGKALNLNMSRYDLYDMFPASWPSIQYQCDPASTPVVVSGPHLGAANGQNSSTTLLPGSC